MTAFIGLVDRKPAYLGNFADKGRPSLRAAYWNLKGQDMTVTTLSYSNKAYPSWSLPAQQPNHSWHQEASPDARVLGESTQRSNDFRRPVFYSVCLLTS
jgi:hypothetical protein